MKTQAPHDKSQRVADFAPVVIGVPSYRRPEGLRQTLTAIAGQRMGFSDDLVRVIVAENDLELRQAQQIVQDIAPQYRFAIEAVASESRGISQARNALLAQGFGRLGAKVLVMIDDDQWIEPDWLDHMIRLWQDTGADAIGCRVVPDFMGAPPNWVQDLPIFHRRSPPSGRVGELVSTGGVLISAQAMEKLENPRFDPAYSLTGGGDTEFFLRLKQAGGTFAFCAEAVAHECYPPDRQTIAWVRRRAERQAMTNTIIRLQQNPGAANRLRQFLRALFGLTKGAVLMPFSIFSRQRREKSIRVLMRAKGQMRAVLGRNFEYYR